MSDRQQAYTRDAVRVATLGLPEDFAGLKGQYFLTEDSAKKLKNEHLANLKNQGEEKEGASEEKNEEGYQISLTIQRFSGDQTVAEKL